MHLAITTFGSEEEGAAVARTLVEEGVVACATLLPGARSIYRWDNAVEVASEVLILFKFADRARDLFAARLKALHSYDTPEIVMWQADASADYAGWVEAAARYEQPGET